MKIFFNPAFDNGCYVNIKDNCSLLGTEILGQAGLMDYLSLHNGLSGLYPSDGERAATYMSHVSKFINGTMMENSFKNDSLNVTKCLLHWRDLLIMAGWEPSQEGNENTPKLQLLSKIETSWKAQLKGSADRWQDLVKLSKNHSLIEENDYIECRCAKESLPRLVQDVLVSCNAKFVEGDDDAEIPESANIKIIHYNDLSDAYKQVAANVEEYKDSVIINRDNVSLNHILFSWGQPLVGATIQESNPLTLQLFKLAMSVFSRPLNIQNLLSYLQLPCGPIPRKLRSSLAYVLINDGGFGDIDWDKLDADKQKEVKDKGISTKWDLAIYDYIKENPKSSANKFLKYITDTDITNDKGISVDILKEYINDIIKWAGTIINQEEDDDDEMMKSLLGTVISYFKQLNYALDGMEEISYQDLEKLVNSIYKPSSITQAQAQVGSLNIVNNCSQLFDTPKNLIWLDCCGADEMVDQYEFLSTAERTWLNEQDEITIPSLQSLLEKNREEMIAALSKVSGDITLVTSDYHHNQKMAEHPIVAELKMMRGDKLEITEGKINLPLSDAKDIKQIKQKTQYNLGKIEYSGRNESNTSIDTLINYPFDYTVNYVAKLKDSTDNELRSLNVVTGLVAHSFIEHLFGSVAELPEEERIDKMNGLLDSEYDTRLKNAIETTGLILLLKENEVDYNDLHYRLKRSIKVLINIMKEKGLIPVGCEVKYDKELDIIGAFNARMDMELKDANGKAVIFDFKWSSSDFYGKKIKEGKSIQLELYRQELMAQGKDVSAVGYYLFPKYVLETSDYDTLKDENGQIIIKHINAPQNINLFEQLQNSFEQRMEEINAGTIEEGEGQDIKDLPYSQKVIDGETIFQVGKIKKKDGPTKKMPDRPWVYEYVKKDSNKVFINEPTSHFYNNYAFDEDAPLNETPTTYPLMKGRLK